MKPSARPFDPPTAHYQAKQKSWPVKGESDSDMQCPQTELNLDIGYKYELQNKIKPC